LLNTPLGVLVNAVRDKATILVSCRNNRKLFGRVKAFDRHFNMVLENVREVWTDTKTGKPEHRDRFLNKVFLRGDNVILVLPNPQ
jgi:small nuclear ribonucleoprotein D2